MNITSLQKGLIFHAPLDGEHLAKDVTPYNNDGTITGATLTTGIKGEANGAMSFDGDDWIDSNSAFQSILRDSFSVSLWIKMDDGHPTGTNCPLAARDSTSANTLSLDCQSGGTVRFYYRSNDIIVDVNPATVIFDDGQTDWVNLVVTAENGGDNLNILYANGELIGSGSNSATIFENYTSDDNIWIGARNYNDSIDLPFSGDISDVRIYNRALSTDEITLLYDSYKPKISTSSLEKGLVGHWALDNITEAKDLSGSGNDGTGAGGITIGGATDRKGLAGGATEFDGSNDYIENTSIDITNNFSVSWWIYPISHLNYNQVFMASGGWGQFYHHTSSGGAIYVGIDVATRFDFTELPNGTLELNTWQHYTFTYDGTDGSFYKNGGLLASKAMTAPDTWTGFKIGISSNSIDGSSNDVRLYNRALSADEITLLYDQYKPKGSSNVGSLNKGLVLDMPLTTKYTKSATVVADRTPYGNDGTVSGATVGSDSSEFNGTTDYIDCGNDESLDVEEITISLWIKLDSFNDWHRWFTTPSDFTNTYTVGESASAGRFGFSTPDPMKNIDAAIAIDTWYHIVAIRSGANETIYVDGVERASSNFSGHTPASGNVIIGNKTGLEYALDGNISGVKIYNRALSADEIKLLYDKGRY